MFLEWRVSTHVQCELTASPKHHNSYPPASACDMVTNKVLKIEIQRNMVNGKSTVLMSLKGS